MNNKIRVLVVDDSAFMRLVISDMLASDPQIHIVGKARNGADAVEKVKRLKPDVVTLDVEMPVMDGVTALKSILNLNENIKVIMVSTLTSEGAETTIKCLELGAFDFVHKPSNSNPKEIEKIKENLLNKIKAAASSLKRLEIPSIPTTPASLKPISAQQKSGPYNMLLIASSTGGPQALMKMLPEIPKDFPAPIAIVQHMPPGFTKNFAARLNQLCQISIEEAAEGKLLVPQKAFIAPGGYHLVVKEKNKKIHCSLVDLPPVNAVKPAADVLFQSISLLENIRPVTVILTGMGKDGAKGALRLKEKNAFVIAESPETAIIFGMPKAAGEVGAVDVFLPLHKIAPKVVELFT